MKKPNKVLILGSGALKIGEAGEFDYSGSQAMKALREEGIETVLVNPNIATFQTSKQLADTVYFLPVKPYFIEKIIKKEKPDGILLSFGGQTALNCGIELYKNKILEKYKVTILGTPMSAIILSEDRDKFAKHLSRIHLPIPKSSAVSTVEKALQAVKDIGFPVMVRAAYTLGGQKSGVAHNPAELEHIVKAALVVSPQVLIEKYLHQFKELEYEIVRDVHDNCVTVCNMENMDPMGIHTGDSIVVAPSQTLNNNEYQTLRSAAIKIVKSLNIVGECNVQFALNPKPKGKEIEFYVIELNARLSRSSALASKATGYPLAYVAAKLALGYGLFEIKNRITQVTQSFFEPALDYIVVKIPRWDLEKFKGAHEKLGSAMKSVGEVMAIGRTFEESFQKALRMLDINTQGPTDSQFVKNKKDSLAGVKMATPRRIFAIAEALKQNISVDEIHTLSGIDRWFLYRIQNIVKKELELKKNSSINRENLLELKQLGFSDKKIAEIIGKKEAEIRTVRKKFHIVPSFFQIDTLAGEVPAKTNYLYATYNGFHNDIKPIGKKAIIVLGSGPYRIGSSVEFDWTCVNTALALRKYKKEAIIINCNPETVSTDYDISERLYFEELTEERVTDIYEFEKPSGIILSVGGQTPNNLAQGLSKGNIKIIGTKAENIDRAENRSVFSKLLDDLKINQPAWNSFTTMSAIRSFANKTGYPLLVRPSYVLSGSAMSVCYSESELKTFIDKATLLNGEHPVTVSKFIPNAKEIEFDGVAEKGIIKIFAISEHYEYAGVHSGDAHMDYPAQKTYSFTEKKIITTARKLVAELSITGPFNIQYLAKENDVYVIEINIRSSRSFPFISKAVGVNFAEVTVDAFFGKSKTYQLESPNYVVVKAPQFSFSRLEGADPVVRVEMSSTGEVACFGETAEEAFLKAELSVGHTFDTKTALLTLGGQENKERFLDAAWRLTNLGYLLYATKNTHNFLKKKGIKTRLVAKVYENHRPNVVDLIANNKVALVINLSVQGDIENEHLEDQISDGYLIRRAAIDKNIPLFTDSNTARFLVKSLSKYKIQDLLIKSWNEYN